MFFDHLSFAGHYHIAKIFNRHFKANENKDMDDVQDQPMNIQTLAEQVKLQSQMIQQLLGQQSTPMHVIETIATPTLHDLPTRPIYTWRPADELVQSMPSLTGQIFDYTLTDDDRRAIIDRYPAVEGLRYTPPTTLPQAARKLSRGQAREDANLKNLQYAASGILRPLDVLAHNVQKQMPHEHHASAFTILNDIRALV